MDDRLGTDFRDPARMPEHQYRLHRAQMRAEHEARHRAVQAAAAGVVTDEQRRWPGLVPEPFTPSDLDR